MLAGNSREIISDDEADKLILALGRGQETFTHEEAESLIQWATEKRMGNSVLNLILDGRVVPFFEKSELKIRVLV